MVPFRAKWILTKKKKDNGNTNKHILASFKMAQSDVFIGFPFTRPKHTK